MTFTLTEPTAASEIKELINQIIQEENLPLDSAKVELMDSRGHRPDIIIFDRLNKPICAIEVKRPFISPYQIELFEQALQYANTEGIRFFATFNFNTLVLWETFKEGVPIRDRRYKEYFTADIIDLHDLLQLSVKNNIKKGLREFLQDLVKLQVAKKTEEILPTLEFDKIFIDYLHSLLNSMKIPLVTELNKKLDIDPVFKNKLLEWLTTQGWDSTYIDVKGVIDVVARQYILLLLNKIMFYKILSSRYKEIRPPNYKLLSLPDELPTLKIPEDITDGGNLQRILKSFFEKVLLIDYETIYESDFLDEIKLPDPLVSPIRILVNEFDKYDFTKIDYEVLGNIFERLIPEKDRHLLGQYFTRSDVVDLIVASCVKNKNDVILDPACGAGTFLIRAYSRLKYLGAEGPHSSFLNKLWGIDIAKFPAHLTTINLAIKDLSERNNYPRVICSDFFKVSPGTKIYSPYFITEGLDKKNSRHELPSFNVVMTNPPYTRQEEMEEKLEEGYKNTVIELIAKETGMTLGKRSSIYAYFFLHGSVFLGDGGRLGLITSNSWLDVDYGKYLQEFFLKNFKIKYIIDSKVERFFEDADINTAITILEKCRNQEERDNNIVKFVELRKKLPEVLSYFGDHDTEYEKWTDKERWAAVDKFLAYLDKISGITINEEIGVRVYPKNQRELYEEGLEEGKYAGSKWGKYIKAPDIFFKILEKGKDLFIPLKDIADITGGIITGKNNFFYLRESQIRNFGIEEKFLIPVIKTPKELGKIYFTKKDLKYKLFFVTEERNNIKGTNALKYIEYGEKQGFNTNPTFKARKHWYQIPELKQAELLWIDLRGEKHICHLNVDNVPFEHNFYGINPKKINKELLCAYLNSTLSWLFIEVLGRSSLGEGAIRLVGQDLKNFPTILLKEGVPDSLKIQKIFDKLKHREIESVFKEVGANKPEEVSLEKVNQDVRELDKVIIGEILGLTDEEQLEVYRAVVDLVKSRIEKAKSVERKSNKEEFSTNIDQIKDIVLHGIDKTIVDDVKKFIPENYDNRVIEIKASKSIEVKVDLHGKFKLVSGEEEVEFSTLEEAEYARYMLMRGKERMVIPRDTQILRDVLVKFKKLDKAIKNRINEYLKQLVSKEKKRKLIEAELYRKIWAAL